MNDNNNIQHNNGFTEDDFFIKAKIPYTRSKSDVWDSMMSKIEAQPVSESNIRILPVFRAVAAIFILAIGLLAFMRFYTKTVISKPGAHLAVALPDDSKVNLNAASSLKYHPYWWKFNREVTLFSGEAFFEVEKGSEFTVVSASASTQVLGTSFNIYARGSEYEVTCITGKVQVNSFETEESIILTPNQKAKVLKTGRFEQQVLKDAQNVIAWTDNMFVFTGVPVGEVFKEIERQYDVKIHVSENINGTYSGNFSREMKVEDVLNIVCRPFGYDFSGSGSEFQVSQSAN